MKLNQRQRGKKRLTNRHPLVAGEHFDGSWSIDVMFDALWGDVAPLSADRRPWITNHLETSNPSGASSGCALHFDQRGGDVGGG